MTLTITEQDACECPSEDATETTQAHGPQADTSITQADDDASFFPIEQFYED